MSPDERYLAPLFRALGVGAPYQWQAAAFARMVAGELPSRIKVPTSAGKTMLLPVFVAAQAARASRDDQGLPRRLVHVVNRRVLVDEASRLSEKMLAVIDADPSLVDLRAALAGLSASGRPLAVSTLRGGLADNGEWSQDPSTPAIILSTPDMLGSRLLFRGYGLGRSRSATHAGLMGIDTLVVHDEAHLAPAFTMLLRQVEALTAAEPGLGSRPTLQVIEMTATLGAAPGNALVCDVTADAALAARMSARKALTVDHVPAGSGKPSSNIIERIVAKASAYADGNQAVAIFVSSPANADRVSDGLQKKGVPPERIVVLTGTMRGHEREALTRTAPFLRFDTGERRTSDGTAYFIATSAGEIGLDIDADVGLFDLTTVDRFIQRAGRINRRGQQQGEIHLFHAAGDEAPEVLRERCVNGLELLNGLPSLSAGFDASPLALSALCDDSRYPLAIEPAPAVRALEPGVLRMLSMTSLRLDQLGCPAPDVYIHGLVDEEPEITLAWRELPKPGADLAEWLDRWPVLPRELAKLPIEAARNFLKKILPGGGSNGILAIALDAQGQLSAVPGVLDPEAPIGRWLYRIRPGSTIILSCQLGGLTPQGLPSPLTPPLTRDPVSDVSGEMLDANGLRRGRIQQFEVRCATENERLVWSSCEMRNESLDGLLADLCAQATREDGERLEVVFHDGPAAGTGEAWSGIVTVWIAQRTLRAPDAGDLSSMTLRDRLLSEHLDLAGRAAVRLGTKLGLDEELITRLGHAAVEHDRGKAWERWQRAIDNLDAAHPLGKSSSKAFDFRVNDGYRHELGSLVDIGRALDDLEAHLVAAHHGWARPGFTDQALAKPGCAVAGEAAMIRFAELSASIGTWRLAWLESVLKAADIQAETMAEQLVLDPPTTFAASSRKVIAYDSSTHSIRVRVDRTNFGEYLAALGLASLVEPLTPGLRIAWDSPLHFVLHGVDDDLLAAALGRLRSAVAVVDDAATVREMRGEAYPPLALTLSDGVAVPLNHWLDERLRSKSNWKLGAGQTTALGTLQSVLAACKRSLELPEFDPTGILELGGGLVGADASKFRFDAATNWSAREAGFSLNESDAFKSTRPWVELLSAIGLQAFFPPPSDAMPAYYVWRQPLPPVLAMVAARGLLPGAVEGFSPVFTPNGQMKDVFPSRPLTSSRSSPCQSLVRVI